MKHKHEFRIVSVKGRSTEDKFENGVGVTEVYYNEDGDLIRCIDPHDFHWSRFETIDDMRDVLGQIFDSTYKPILNLDDVPH
jgi:hypothetical protein